LKSRLQPELLKRAERAFQPAEKPASPVNQGRRAFVECWLQLVTRPAGRQLVVQAELVVQELREELEELEELEEPVPQEQLVLLPLLPVHHLVRLRTGLVPRSG